jgi:predicted nuclease with TOPRIM domain
MTLRRLEVVKSGLEERVARIEGILEQVDKRLNHLESEVRELRRDLNNRFFWLLGIQISMWVTIILAILFK